MSEKPKVTQAEINAIVWKACDTFRSVVDPSEYKNYILVFLFIKYLSDVWKETREKLEKRFKGDEGKIQRRLERERFILPPGSDYYSIYENRSADNIGEIINKALDNIEEANKKKLENVFRNIDFNSSSNLGQTKDRNRRLKNLIEDFADPRLDLRPSQVGSQDIIGNAYEYLISRFASDAGKKGGEFYTPAEVAILLARLVDPKPGSRICDPACGSGSLLIRVADEVGEENYSLFGMESNGSTWALCKMNMFLHRKDSARIEWCDALSSPALIEKDSLMKFDIVVANPPFSLDKWGDGADDPFQRFHRGTPPGSRGDYAFISHMVETAVEATGKVAVIVPHGVLFRGASEGIIRRSLIEENILESVIGLPPNIFYGTGIPVAILVFNKGRKDDKVLFIDASREFESGKNQNRLRKEDLDKIVKTFQNRKTTPKYSYLAALQEIRENEHNLNIPRYVDTFEEEEPVDMAAVHKEIKRLEGELKDVQKEMDGYLKELGQL